ncbi:related to squalene cyclase [Phialocephala subalpina]|uniref:lanosterol synthase n=1 Tax=Phialocephala subalpina TaxID=576137 RepID=A0A1L7XK59_9HELO|nr:related to squalene cyclase [Phialocephala subalpina]
MGSHFEPESHEEKILRSLSSGAEYAFEKAEDDGHWYALGLDLRPVAAALKQELFSDQHEDGSWGIGYGLPGEISTTVEAYLELRLLDVPSDTEVMRKARKWIVGVGSIAKVRIFTRIFLAMFGLFPWSAVPQLPPELILMPPQTLVNLTTSLFSRFLMACLQTTTSQTNCGATQGTKIIPYAPSLFELWRKEGIFSWEFGFTIADTALYYLSTAIQRSPTRKYAIKKCVEWVLERQEKAGDWAGIIPPMMNGLIILHLEGWSHDSDEFSGGLEAIDRFMWKHEKGMHLQACVSPIWDTVLMTIGLRDAGIPGSDKCLQTARIYRPKLTSGGWSFEYHNTWYPDVDDTAAVIIAFLKQDPECAGSSQVHAAVEWVLGMQNADGGWAAFDVNNNYLFMNKCPFSDLDALCDPKRLILAIHHGINYLASIQESDGSWWGRWGVNYVYGTSNVFCTLAYSDGGRVETMVNPALQWLKKVQRADGGWGECLATYKYPELADESIKKGVAFLIETQVDFGGKGFSWIEPNFTGTGFYFPLMALGRYSKAMKFDRESMLNGTKE